MADDCIFCKIASGEIPSQEVLQTETTYAFRDLDPQAPTHVLVIPKRHIASADQVTAADGPVLADMMTTAQQIAASEASTAQDGRKGYRLVFNVGDDAGNTVPHLHLHVLAGRELTWPPG